MKSTLKTRLAKARVAAGITQEELAKISGISVEQIYHFERGARKLTPKTATVFSIVLGVSGHWLMGYGNKAEPLALDGEPLTREKFEAFRQPGVNTKQWNMRGAAWLHYLNDLIHGSLRGWSGTPMIEELGCSISEAIAEVARRYYIPVPTGDKDWMPDGSSLSNFESVDEALKTMKRSSKPKLTEPRPAQSNPSKRISGRPREG